MISSVVVSAKRLRAIDLGTLEAVLERDFVLGNCEGVDDDWRIVRFVAFDCRLQTASIPTTDLPSLALVVIGICSWVNSIAR